MPTPLENAIDSLSDPKVSVPDALRRLLVVSRRINAVELTAWLRSELDGYGEGRETPLYRKGAGLPIRLHFDGPMRSSSTMTVSRTDLPNDLGRIMEAMDFREPAAELAALSQGDDDPSLQLPMVWIQLYRQKIDEGSAPSISMMVLNRASIVMPRTHLVGILDRVKSTALDLALSLEDVTREAGLAGGPTVDDDPRIAREVYVHLTQLFAPGSTITLGDHASVASGPGSVAVQLQVGDLEGLITAASAYLASDAVEELRLALSEDGGQTGAKTRSFLDRVRSGGVTLAAGVTTNGAYAGIVALLHQAFGG